MAFIAVVSHDVQTVNGRGGGVAAFTLHWIRLLRAQRPADRLRLIYTTTYASPHRIDDHWRQRYQAWGIEVVECHAPEPEIERGPFIAEQILSEQVYPHIVDADVVYFADWGHAGFHLLRRRRLCGARKPVCATVAHGGSEWIRQGSDVFPNCESEYHRIYIERYALAHSDYLISPSRYMIDWLQSVGCRLPPAERQRVVGLPVVVDANLSREPPPATVASVFRRIIFFNGRIERRKGIDLFSAGLEQAHARGGLDGLEEVVLVAASVIEREDILQGLLARLRSIVPRVRVLCDLDSFAAQDVLRQKASDSLVVIPSLLDNYPYAVIEATLIPGITLLCSEVGGIPEIVGESSPCLFRPTPLGLATRLIEAWSRGPQSHGSRYDLEQANRAWLDLHDELVSRSRGAEPASPPAQRPRVDVCVPFFNAGRFLPQLLESLSRQSYPSLMVIVVDDGSSDPHSIQVFDDLQRRYPAWTFHRQENRFVDAARNRASTLGDGELLLFVDPDEVLAPEAVARLVDAIEHSGDDVITCNALLFASLEPPYVWSTGERTARIERHLTPLGPSLVSGILNGQVYGTVFILVRRCAFEAVGGYTCQPGVGHEDWELMARFALRGLRIDVLPDDLLYVRAHGGGLSTQLDLVECRRRLLHPYEQALAPLGLQGLAQLTRGLQDQNVTLKQQLRRLERRAELRRRPYRIVADLQHDLDLDLPGLTPLDLLRYAYRRLVPLQTRLRLHQRVVSAWRRLRGGREL
jgi:glycosyltransferase involved in cell wall biosynthesis